jgi:hypothetical protein
MGGNGAFYSQSMWLRGQPNEETSLTTTNFSAHDARCQFLCSFVVIIRTCMLSRRKRPELR